MSMQSPFLDLNPEQRQGVETTQGPVLVIAGAGSGKTKMLTSRIVHLIREKKVSPHNILAVTFTNKAAGEMRARVNQSLGAFGDDIPTPYYMSYSLTQPQIGTFHSICVQILRREITRTPFKQQFVIYDDSDQLSLIKDCFAKLGLSEKAYSPKSFQWAINTAKCWVQKPEEVNDSENFQRLYQLYQSELFKSNAIDFGEIILLAYRLLNENPDILEKYQNLFQYIHVDEYQDTNRAQYLLIRALASKHRNLCVVGDEDQSIYKWRGADIRNILDFEKDYPEAQVIKLEQNYRSTQTIVNASSHVIAKNSQRKPKTLWTENSVGDKIQRFQVPDDRTESELVVGSIKSMCSLNYSYSDIAIFYRTNAQSRVFEDVLRRERIPYKVVGGLRFYDRKEIKDVLAYFRVLANPSDAVSMKRIINVPQRSIGKATVEKIEEFSFQTGVTFEQALRGCAIGDVLANAAKRKVGDFANILDDMREFLAQKTLSEFYHELLDRIGYVRELKDEGTEEAQARIENLQELDTILSEFEATQIQVFPQGAKADLLLPLFLENVTLVGEQDEKNEAAALVTGSVSLMTLHSSKGLEFPVVFMVGLEEGLFPSIRPFEAEKEEDVEEERRLCYVGMTRAKEKLFMTNAICRRVYGNIVYHEPARFFDEIPSDFIDFTDLTRMRSLSSGTRSDSAARSSYYDERQGVREGFSPTVPVGREEYNDQESSYSSQPRTSSISPTSVGTANKLGFPIGSRVRHDVYGEGTVKSLEGSAEFSPETAKVTVEFSNRSVKKFVLKYANLQRV